MTAAAIISIAAACERFLARRSIYFFFFLPFFLTVLLPLRS